MITIQSNSALLSSNFFKLNSLSFRSSFIINTEPIEPILNGIFAKRKVKYDVDREIMRNSEKL
jgi:hypothetical protein